MKYTSIILIFLLSATSYSAEFIPKKLSQMTDDLGAGYIAQNGTGTLSAATIAGVAAPYIAQNNGTGTGITLNGTKLSGNTAIGTTTAATDVVDIDLGSGNMLIQSSSAYPQIQEIRGGAAADGNLLATKIYQGKDSAGNSTNYAGIYSASSSVTNGSEIGAIDFYLSDAGTYAFRGRWKGANLGIGTSTPQTKLSVAGDISIQSSGYLNYGNGTSSSGYGIRDNSGTMQYKNSAGAWTDIPSGATGGGWTDNGTTITENTVTDQVIIGSTTASGSNILTVVGSTTVNDLSISNALGLGFTGTPVIDMAIGDNDTGINYVSDGIYDIFANNNTVMRIDGNIPNRISVGTTTLGTTINVSGTVTASGFSGNGAGLTSLSSAFSAITGTPTDNSFFSTTAATNKVPFTGNGTDLYNFIPSGSLINHSYGSYTAYTTWTASSAYIPFDNTIPQSSEGVEILTVTHTPKAIGNILAVHVSAPFGTNDNDSHAIAALFLDSESNARMVGVNAVGNGAPGFLCTTINFIYKMSATGTSSVTFKLRGGSSANSANLFLVNGIANAQYFGGIYATSLEVLEFKQ